MTRGAALWRRPRGQSPPPEDGFTLIEVMLVIVVIGILIATSMPSFLSARQTSQDRGAQADLRHALEAANTAYIDQQDFGTFTYTTLAAVEPGLRFNDQTSGSRGTVGVTTGSCDSPGGPLPCLALAESASDGSCWYVVQSNDAAPLYGKGPSVGGACDAGSPQNLAADFPA
ncbi:MAG TPA: type II secretion system protein [Acidimicrobiales bacterium]|nr:type II secretion system protein [Acidimicrobiales bacterium]